MTRICIDIDDVIFRTSDYILETLGLFFGEQYNKENIKTYDIEKTFKLPHDVVSDAIDIAVSNEYPKLETDSDKVIEWLSQFYDITLLTSRDASEYLDCTQDALINRSIKFNALVFDDNKTFYINSNDDIEVFIEDNPKYIGGLLHNDNTTLLVYDKPWNRQFIESDCLHRVYSWQEVKEWFMIKLGG